MYSSINNICFELTSAFDSIFKDRKLELEKIANYISDRLSTDSLAQLNVICTHNSRRSHIGAIWLRVAGDYYGIENIHSFSGGTEATALNIRVVNALRASGFEIRTQDNDVDNPHYFISWNEEMIPMESFSKVYSESPNPTENFAAIMVCTSADEGCPIVKGADFRLALPFKDPKEYDDTDQEMKAYLSKIREIGMEILYCISLVKKT